MYGRNLNAYRKTSLNAEVAVADPYTITKMLYQGIFERLAQAKGAIERGDLALKSKKLSGASAIIENLRSTLDFTKAKGIAEGLYQIYTFMLDCIADAAVELSTKPIDSAMRAFLPIKRAWDSIPAADQRAAEEMRRAEMPADYSNNSSLAHGSI
ncbi:MAG: flagellar export chaperone FliS [Succinivibrionaceae bacterium]|nr:flagellar export chaperone FliS [Succinivibrionaceae bacterium]